MMAGEAPSESRRLRMGSLGFSLNFARLAGFSYRSKMLETTTEWLLHG
jgi:hypothetical protein